jgi:hypothetical protein
MGKIDFADGYRNDLKAGWLPEMVLTSARKHQEGLRELPVDTPDRDKAMIDIETLISEIVAAGY